MSQDKNFTRSQRDQIAKEAIESNSQKATAVKYNIPVSRLYGWVKSYKDRDIQESSKSTKQYQQEIADLELEVKVLRELLKKTTQTLIKD